jgi:hypothetical protein
MTILNNIDLKEYTLRPHCNNCFYSDVCNEKEDAEYCYDYDPLEISIDFEDYLIGLLSDDEYQVFSKKWNYYVNQFK